jgi:hypothetical protein
MSCGVGTDHAAQQAAAADAAQRRFSCGIRPSGGVAWLRVGPSAALGRAAEPQAVRQHTLQFAKALRPRIQSGEITCSVCIWQRPQVKVGGRYSLPPGEIEVVSLRGITRDQISTALAKRSGFDSVAELLKVAQHGKGEFVFVVEFVYHGPC